MRRKKGAKKYVHHVPVKNSNVDNDADADDDDDGVWTYHSSREPESGKWSL